LRYPISNSIGQDLPTKLNDDINATPKDIFSLGDEKTTPHPNSFKYVKARGPVTEAVRHRSYGR